MESILYLTCCMPRNTRSTNTLNLLIILGIIYMICLIYFLNNINTTNYFDSNNLFFLILGINGCGNINIPLCIKKNRNQRRRYYTEYRDIEQQEQTYLSPSMEINENNEDNENVETSQYNIITNKKIYKWKTKINILYEEKIFYCEICFEDKHLKCIFDNCNHTMCSDCLILIRKDECPFCRTKISELTGTSRTSRTSRTSITSEPSEPLETLETLETFDETTESI